MNQDLISWPSCHLQAVRPGNNNAYLRGVNVSPETDGQMAYERVLGNRRVVTIV